MGLLIYFLLRIIHKPYQNVKSTKVEWSDMCVSETSCGKYTSSVNIRQIPDTSVTVGCVTVISDGSRIFRWGAPTCWGGGRWPLTRMLFGQNICENERIGSGWGVRASGAPPWIHHWFSSRCYLWCPLASMTSIQCCANNQDLMLNCLVNLCLYPIVCLC